MTTTIDLMSIQVCYNDEEAVQLVLPEMLRLSTQTLVVWQKRDRQKSTPRTTTVVGRLKREIEVVKDQLKFGQEMLEIKYQVPVPGYVPS